MEHRTTNREHRAPGTEHIPRYPRGFIVLRILQLINSFVCLGLSAYLTADIGLDYALPCNILMLFTATVSSIVSMWCITYSPRAYNYWAMLACEIFFSIFWLICFSLTAKTAADFRDGDYYSDWGYSYYDRYYNGYLYDRYGSVLTAAAIVAASNFLFFLISLFIHSCAIHRHRQAGLPSARIRPDASEPYTMQPQSVKPTYAAVPQQSVPMHHQQTSYDPHEMYCSSSPATTAPSQSVNWASGQELEGSMAPIHEAPSVDTSYTHVAQPLHQLP